MNKNIFPLLFEVLAFNRAGGIKKESVFFSFLISFFLGIIGLLRYGERNSAILLLVPALRAFLKGFLNKGVSG